jgi:hypothetical protein
MDDGSIIAHFISDVHHASPTRQIYRATFFIHELQNVL